MLILANLSSVWRPARAIAGHLAADSHWLLGNYASVVSQCESFVVACREPLYLPPRDPLSLTALPAGADWAAATFDTAVSTKPHLKSTSACSGVGKGNPSSLSPESAAKRRSWHDTGCAKLTRGSCRLQQLSRRDYRMSKTAWNDIARQLPAQSRC